MDYPIAALVLIGYLVFAILTCYVVHYVLQYEKRAATREQAIRAVLLVTVFLGLLIASYIAILAVARGF